METLRLRLLVSWCLTDAPRELGSSIFCRFLEAGCIRGVLVPLPFAAFKDACAFVPLACGLLRLSDWSLSSSNFLCFEDSAGFEDWREA
jgi:hypothetical protein